VTPAKSIPVLPADAEALRALVLATVAERDAAVAERDQLLAEREALTTRNERLHALLLKLSRVQFGRKSERLPEEQFQLGLEDLEAAAAKNQAEAEKHDPALRHERAVQRRASRGALPSHLPRIDVELTPPDTACPCCRATMVQIGEDISERLDVIPAQFRVLVTRRPKLACRACAGTIVQQPAPPRLIEGGIPTEALVAHVLVAPLRRSSSIIPPGPDVGPARGAARSCHPGLLGRGGGGRDRAGDAPPQGHRVGLGAPVRR
jgi:transposase